MIIRYKLFFSIILSIFFSFNSFSQTISLSDFNKEAEKEKSNSNEELKLKREKQKGIAIHFFGSITGSSEQIFDLYNLGSDWQKEGSILKGYDTRISYTKESFIPFGIYFGYGSANLFLGGNSYPSSTDTSWSGEITSLSDVYEPLTSNYFVIGLSKNLSHSSTIYLGYVQFDDVERTSILQTTNIQENIGFNIGYTHRLKSFAISIDNILHLPYYKETVVPAGNKVGEEFTFGHRLQIGLGYIF